MRVKVFIDWNQDGIFNPSEEYVLGEITNNDNASVSGTIQVPNFPISQPGPTRMRVMKKFGTVPDNYTACNTTGYGQAEDYTVNVTGSLPGTSTPTISWSGSPIVTGGNTLTPTVNPSSNTTYTITGELNGCTETSTVDVIVDCPLPVTLTHFSASSCDEDIKLSWITESEQNSDRFIIEKSRDGQNWFYVAEQEAAGNSSSTINYTQIISNPWGGVSYYRLRQVDFDGKEEIFGPISVSCDESEINMVVYPNPNIGSFTIEVSGNNKSTDANLTLRDISGKLVFSKYLEVSVGSTQVLIDDINLSKGVYFVKLQEKNLQL